MAPLRDYVSPAVRKELSNPNDLSTGNNDVMKAEYGELQIYTDAGLERRISLAGVWVREPCASVHLRKPLVTQLRKWFLALAQILSQKRNATHSLARMPSALRPNAAADPQDGVRGTL